MKAVRLFSYAHLITLLTYGMRFLILGVLCLVTGWQLFGWDGVSGFSHLLYGGQPDNLSFVWIFERLGNNILTLAPNIWDGQILYPSKESLIFSETMSLSSVTYALFFRLVDSRPIALNLMVLFFGCLNTLSFYAFARAFTGRLAAGVAAVFFSVSMIRLAQLGAGHFHVLPQFPFPLVALCLLRFERTERARYLFGAAALTALQFYFSVTLGMILGVSLLPYPIVRLIKKKDRLRFVSLGVLGLFVFGLVAAPLGKAYFGISSRQGLERPIKEVNVYVNHAPFFLLTPPGHLYSRLIPDKPRYNDFRHEKVQFIGFVALFLCIVALRRSKRKTDPSSRFWRTVYWSTFFFGIVLSLGPKGYVYSLLYYTLPGMKGIRTPLRFSFTYLFLISVALAFVLQWLRAQWSERKGRALVLGAALLILLENFWLVPKAPIPGRLQGVSQFLAALPERGPVVHIPFGPRHLYDAARVDGLDAERMYAQLIHNHPIANGYTGFPTKAHGDLLALVNGATSDAAKLEQVRERGFRYFVVEKQPLNEDETKAWATTLADKPKVYEDAAVTVYALSKT